MSSLAISIISASVPTPLKAFSAHNMNRQLAWVYPLFGSILSILGERMFRPGLFKMKGMPVSSQLPVQRALHHSMVKSNGMPSLVERIRMPLRIMLHGSRKRL